VSYAKSGVKKVCRIPALTIFQRQEPIHPPPLPFLAKPILLVTKHSFGSYDLVECRMYPIFARGGGIDAYMIQCCKKGGSQWMDTKPSNSNNGKRRK
jgi:hypothetical protein